MFPARRALMIGLALVTGACTTYGVIENKPPLPGEGNPGYSLGEFATKLNRQSDELTLAVAFSGGGTRAAALSYGVMQELYNVATLQQTQQTLERWARELSTPERPVTQYFIRLSFEEVPEGPLRRFLNEIPTSFALDDVQVDRLIAAGRELLRNNAEFRRLLASLQGQAGPAAPSSTVPSR